MTKSSGKSESPSKISLNSLIEIKRLIGLSFKSTCFLETSSLRILNPLVPLEIGGLKQTGIEG